MHLLVVHGVVVMQLKEWGRFLVCAASCLRYMLFLESAALLGRSKWCGGTNHPDDL